jgi:Ca2+-binding RTX toxin-like protein
LYYPTYSPGRWNAQTNVGTQTIITYSFTDTADLQSLAEYDPYGATAYWAYTEAQRTLMREVMAKFEAVAGVKFVEIEGDSMINIFGADVSGVGGWANIAYSNEYANNPTGNGNFVNAYKNMDEGDYGYQVNIHELGHAMGLQHPHEGDTTLDPLLDTQANTVMTYNISNPYVTELGVFDIQALQDIYGVAGGMDSWVITVDVNDDVDIRASNDGETILATDQNTSIKAFKGDDLVIGREGNDTLNAGQGEDTVIGAQGADRIVGRSGNDLLIGDVDEQTYSNDDGTDKDRIFGQGGDDTIFGGRGKDLIAGGEDNDLLFGQYGDDQIRGGDGDDTIAGGDGADRLTGNAGADVFVFDSYDIGEMDKISDFTVGDDTIDLSSFGFMTFNSLTITQVGNHTIVEYSDWFDVQLLNFTASTLSASDFDFVA